jgi:curli production assembly/transport component CsgG
MERKRLFSCLLAIFLFSGCAVFEIVKDTRPERFQSKGLNKYSIFDLQSKELALVQAPSIKPVVAVYPTAFLDQTGQRKSNGEYALFSSAITQAPYVILIRSLKHAAGGDFFRVVERVGLDNLTKERMIIRQGREDLDESQKLGVLLYAGVLLEGAVVSYDTNINTGGIGSRMLGIGSSMQYREDTVSVSLRMVSVVTGEILIEVMSQKTIYSYAQSQDLFRFYEMGTELIEVEMGTTENESITLALMKAIEGAVLELILIGYERGYWKYEQTIN